MIFGKIATINVLKILKRRESYICYIRALHKNTKLNVCKIRGDLKMWNFLAAKVKGFAVSKLSMEMHIYKPISSPNYSSTCSALQGQEMQDGTLMNPLLIT